MVTASVFMLIYCIYVVVPLLLMFFSIRYLAAKCYVESKQWQAALDLLEQLPQDELLSKKHSNSLPIEGVPEDKVGCYR